MITPDASFALDEGSLSKHTGVIYVHPKLDSAHDTILCHLVAVGATADAPFIAETYYSTTKAAVDAKTGTGTETAAFLDAVELVVIDYLDAITENAAVTFTN